MKRGTDFTELLQDLLMHAEVIDLAALGEILQIWTERQAK